MGRSSPTPGAFGCLVEAQSSLPCSRSDPLRVVEYQVAESDALAFKAAGYAGPVPASVSVWATAKGWTAQQAADDILAAAQLWRQALIGLRQARLAGKEGVRQAADDAAASAAHQQSVLTIKAILAQVIG